VKTEATGSSNFLAPIYQTAQLHILEAHYLNICHSNNINILLFIA